MDVDKTIKAAKLWIQQNRPPYPVKELPKKPEIDFWVDAAGGVHKNTEKFVPMVQYKFPP